MSGHRRHLLIAAALIAAIVALVKAGVVPEIDLEKALHDLAEKLGRWTYLLVGLMAFLETGAFVGLIAPGEFTVILGGVVAGQGEISVSLLLGIVWFSAFAGDSVSFALGSRLGRDVVLRHGHRIGLSRERFAQVERYFDKHGGKTILIGRFIGLVRALAPFIAGSSRMRYRNFVPYCILGTGLWSAILVFVGYFFSQSLDQVAKWVGRGSLAFGIAVATVVGVVLAIRFLRDPANRRRLAAFIERTPVLRLLVPVVRPAWRLIAPQVRFLWGRITPGSLGLEFTTMLAIGAVGTYVLGFYMHRLGMYLGPTTGDSTAFDVVRNIDGAWLTDLAKVGTRLGAAYVTWALAVAGCAVLAWRRRWLEFGVLVLGLALTIAGVHLLKEEIARPRPPNPVVGTEGYAFPSGHAAYSMVYVVLAVIAARVVPALATRFVVVGVGMALAAAIGLSRVYLRAHYLSDVLAGWALAAGLFGLCAAVALVVSHLRQNARDAG